MDAPELLRVLDALLSRDRAPSGLEGVVAIGVRTPSRTWWWRAELSPPRASFVEAAPTDARATLLVGEVEAAAIVAGAELSEGAELTLRGDPALLRAFAARYTAKRTALSLRASPPPLKKR